jgi:hypothetical protein
MLEELGECIGDHLEKLDVRVPALGCKIEAKGARYILFRELR